MGPNPYGVLTRGGDQDIRETSEMSAYGDRAYEGTVRRGPSAG